MKELVMVLELSENGIVLRGIQKWTKAKSKGIMVDPPVGLKLIPVRLPSLSRAFQEAIKSLLIDLPQDGSLPTRRMLSELTTRSEVEPRTY